jgi:putative two-component system protein, hydrogenase maturation factor HypX/HoxX
MTAALRLQRILFLVSAHNGLSQRAYVELTELGHEVGVAVVDSAAEMEAAVRRHRPELIVCPMLKKFIPESIWTRHRCLIVHPGPKGDRGPSSLDWAIELGEEEWGVTVLEANGEADAGDIWAGRSFPTRDVGKSGLYRHEVRRVAVESLVEAIDKIAAGGAPANGRPRRPRRDRAGTSAHAPVGPGDRLEGGPTETVVRKIRAAEGHPGVLDELEGADFHLFGVHREGALTGRAGEIIAQRAGGICRATVDGAVWITHLTPAEGRGETPFKLPAALALALAGHELGAPEIPAPLHVPPSAAPTYR